MIKQVFGFPVYITNIDEKLYNKKEIINDIVDYRMGDITNFFDECKDKLPAKKIENIQRFIDRMNNEEDVIKGIKKEEIQLILYNKKEN